MNVILLINSYRNGLRYLKVTLICKREKLLSIWKINFHTNYKSKIKNIKP